MAAIDWFLSEIFPKLTEKLPGIQFNIVGQWKSDSKKALSTYPKTIQNALSCKRRNRNHVDPECLAYKNINWKGKLSSDELDASLGEARIFISPILFSTGVNTKNLLALERGLPLITSPTGAAGLCPEVKFIVIVLVLFQTIFRLLLCDFIQNACKKASPVPYIVAANVSEFIDFTARVYTDAVLWNSVRRCAAYNT